MPRQIKQVPTASSSTTTGIDRVALLDPLIQVNTSPTASVDPADPLPRKRDIARKYSVSIRTVDRWVNEKKIPYLYLDKRTIRFRWEAVERAVNRLTVKEVA
jgi:hypothetical protein